MALVGMVASAVLSLYFAADYPVLTAVPAVIINCCALQVHPIHGLLFSAIEIPYLMLIFWPIKVLLRIPLQYAFFFLYSPIVVIFGRARKDRHSRLGEWFIRWIWDPPLLATIWLVGLTRLGGDRFLFPFCTVLDDRIGALEGMHAMDVPLLPGRWVVYVGSRSLLRDLDFDHSTEIRFKIEGELASDYSNTISYPTTTPQPWARCRCPGTSRPWSESTTLVQS